MGSCEENLHDSTSADLPEEPEQCQKASPALDPADSKQMDATTPASTNAAGPAALKIRLPPRGDLRSATRSAAPQSSLTIRIRPPATAPARGQTSVATLSPSPPASAPVDSVMDIDNDLETSTRGRDSHNSAIRPSGSSSNVPALACSIEAELLRSVDALHIRDLPRFSHPAPDDPSAITARSIIHIYDEMTADFSRARTLTRELASLDIQQARLISRLPRRDMRGIIQERLPELAEVDDMADAMARLKELNASVFVEEEAEDVARATGSGKR